jgi:hypothetical protein
MKIREADEEFGHGARRFYGVPAFSDLAPQKFVPLGTICQDREQPRPFVAGCGRCLKSFEPVKSVCAQCAHLGPRIGSYSCRIGPDCICFLEFPAFARVGMQFDPTSGTHSPSPEGVLL